MCNAAYAADLLRALAAQGVEVVQFHPEYAAGQLEISVAAESPVAAADTTVLVRTTIRAVATRHGLRVSFAPSVIAGGVGNGGHVHLSVSRDGRNLMCGGEGRYGLTGEGEAFIAGILARLPALLAIGAPSVASYLRLVSSHWAGVFGCWGWENREAAVRLITGSVGDQCESANVEVKCVDASANPYLLLAVLLACGMAGIEQEGTLPGPVDVDPASWFDVEPVRPADAEVRAAAVAWLPQRPGARLADPVLLRHALWCGVDTGLPLQLHTGFGDGDEDLHRANPILLTGFRRATAATGTPVVLLHCYPYHREAAWLAHVFGHVYLDVGLASTFAGARASALLAAVLEIAPFDKVLYSSDAFGLAELYHVAALRFRRAVHQVLDGWRRADEASEQDVQRIAAMIAGGNAYRLYRLSRRVATLDTHRSSA